MPKPTLGTGSAGARKRIAADATYEIEAIVRVLRRLEDTTTNWLLMRGLFQRIETLNSVAMSVVGGDDGRTLGDMEEDVYGAPVRGGFTHE